MKGMCFSSFMFCNNVECAYFTTSQFNLERHSWIHEPHINPHVHSFTSRTVGKTSWCVTKAYLIAKKKKLAEACKCLVLENTKLTEANLRLNPPAGYSSLYDGRSDRIPGKSNTGVQILT